MIRSVIASVWATTVLAGMGAVTLAEAKNVCKDGYITSTGNVPSAQRSTAEANAIRAWRRGASATVPEADRIGEKPNVRCVQDRKSGTWRCFVRAGRCATG